MLSVGASSRSVNVSSRHDPRELQLEAIEEGLSNNLCDNGPERGWRADVAQVVERLTCNQQVVGSTPTIGSAVAVGTEEERCPSGQREQTVNLPAYAFGGSNPPLSIARDAGVAQLAELEPSKFEVAGSNPVSRS